MGKEGEERRKGGEWMTLSQIPNPFPFSGYVCVDSSSETVGYQLLLSIVAGNMLVDHRKKISAEFEFDTRV